MDWEQQCRLLAIRAISVLFVRPVSGPAGGDHSPHATNYAQLAPNPAFRIFPNVSFLQLWLFLPGSSCLHSYLWVSWTKLFDCWRLSRLKIEPASLIRVICLCRYSPLSNFLSPFSENKSESHIPPNSGKRLFTGFWQKIMGKQSKIKFWKNSCVPSRRHDMVCWKPAWILETVHAVCTLYSKILLKSKIRCRGKVILPKQ